MSAEGASCAICAQTDQRALLSVDLPAGSVVLCGSHELMHRRAGASARDLLELRAMLGDRRRTDRRAARGEVDELAERLTAAFTRDRRALSRRAG